MNDITPKTSIAPYAFAADGDDGFSLVATPAEATFRAAFLDFKQGDWLLGSEQTAIPVGTEFVVHAVVELWVRLVKGERVRRIPREPGKPFLTRNELGDLDKSEWPVFNGEPSDPWKLQSEMLMADRKTGQLVIYRTNSWSGRDVVGDLCRKVTFQRRQRGDNAKPIVAIGVVTRPHPRGSYKAPVFNIVGWLGQEETAPERTPNRPINDLSEDLQVRGRHKDKETLTTREAQSHHKKAPAAHGSLRDALDDENPW
jgi:hypothetical protein